MYPAPLLPYAVIKVPLLFFRVERAKPLNVPLQAATLRATDCQAVWRVWQGRGGPRPPFPEVGPAPLWPCGPLGSLSSVPGCCFWVRVSLLDTGDSEGGGALALAELARPVIRLWGQHLAESRFPARCQME